MATANRNSPVKNMSELRFKLAEKFAALENGEISVGDAKAFAGIASAIINTCKVEMVNNSMLGAIKEIDFLNEISKPIATPISQAFANNTPRTGKNGFVRPTKDELANYFHELNVDYDKAKQEAERFLDFFDANGWVVGTSKAAMKDWRASVRNWVNRMGQFKSVANGSYPVVNGKRGTSEARIETARNW